MICFEVNSPLIVFYGDDRWKNKNARLVKEYAKCPGSVRVSFPRIHWFDGYLVLEYLQWIVEKHPGHKILLLWDHATAPLREDVENFLNAKGVFVICIPEGMNFIIQICDLMENKPIKGHIKYSF